MDFADCLSGLLKVMYIIICDSFTYGVFVGQTVPLNILQLHLMSNDSGNPEIK